jgi:hypothetical protein
MVINGDIMQTQQIKSFFLFSLSVLMLFACCTGGFYLWKNEHKMARLDSYYEFRLFYMGYQDLESNYVAAMEHIEKVEQQMLQDGYDRAEIDEITSKAKDYNRRRGI